MYLLDTFCGTHDLTTAVGKMAFLPQLPGRHLPDNADITGRAKLRPGTNDDREALLSKHKPDRQLQPRSRTWCCDPEVVAARQ